jgi:hypothetical protein
MGDVISNATNDMKVPTKFAAHQSKATGSVDLYALNELNGAIGHQRACLKRTRLAQGTPREADHSSTASLSNLSTSLDHAIRLCQERFREREASRSGGLHVHDQLELGRLLDWDVPWICAVENLVDVGGRTAKIVRE